MLDILVESRGFSSSTPKHAPDVLGQPVKPLHKERMRGFLEARELRKEFAGLVAIEFD